MRVQASNAVSSRDLWEDQRWPAFGVLLLAFAWCSDQSQSPFSLPKVVSDGFSQSGGRRLSGALRAGRPDPMGKKGKAPALATEPEELKHLGVCVNDLIQTPLGVVATVAGLDVKEGVASSQPPGHPATQPPTLMDR